MILTPCNVDCHVTLPRGVVSMQLEGRYHALAKERTILLRCESLEPPMSQSGHERRKRSGRGSGACPLRPESGQTCTTASRHYSPTSSASDSRLSPLQVAEPILRPAGVNACLVVWRRAHGGRKALTAPLGPTGVLPRAGCVDQHPVPKPCAELRHVAILQRRAGIDRGAEDPREDDHSALTSVDAVRER